MSQNEKEMQKEISESKESLELEKLSLPRTIWTGSRSVPDSMRPTEPRLFPEA